MVFNSCRYPEVSAEGNDFLSVFRLSFRSKLRRSNGDTIISIMPVMSVVSYAAPVATLSAVLMETTWFDDARAAIDSDPFVLGC